MKWESLRLKNVKLSEIRFELPTSLGCENYTTVITIAFPFRNLLQKPIFVQTYDLYFFYKKNQKVYK